MALERAFYLAGGLLMGGPDPTGDGGTLPGFGDQREIELLVEAGFKPVEAIKIATLNGATYLGRATSIGSIAVGKECRSRRRKGRSIHSTSWMSRTPRSFSRMAWDMTPGSCWIR